MRLAWAASLSRLLGLAVLGAGLAACAHSRPQNWSATVVHVSDGDTIYVRESGQDHAVPVRLLGIDAPEICQRGGEASQQALSELVLHQRVSLVGSGHDSYGRELARVFWKGRDVGAWMVAQGQAWSYRRGKDPGPYIAEQRQAQTARLGLFAQARPEPPRSFRQRHGSCRAER